MFLSFMPSRPLKFPRMLFGGNSPSCIKPGTLEVHSYQYRLTSPTPVGI
jgi:hypothetical protein